MEIFFKRIAGAVWTTRNFSHVYSIRLKIFRGCSNSIWNSFERLKHLFLIRSLSVCQPFILLVKRTSVSDVFAWEVTYGTSFSLNNWRAAGKNVPKIFWSFSKCSKIAEFWHVGFVSPGKHCSEVFFCRVGLRFWEITYAKLTRFSRRHHLEIFSWTKNNRNMIILLNSKQADCL